MKTLAVERDDAGGFLAAMLQGMQAERGDGRGIGMAENAEYAAFLAQPVPIGRSRKVPARSVGISARHSPSFDAGASCRRGSIDRSRRRRARRGVSISRCWSGAALGGFRLRACRSSASSRWCFRGPPATSTSANRPVPCSTTCDFALRIHSGWLRSGTSQAKNRKATTTMIRPRAEPEQEAERAVERADPAVEHHVGESAPSGSRRSAACRGTCRRSTTAARRCRC